MSTESPRSAGVRRTARAAAAGAVAITGVLLIAGALTSSGDDAPPAPAHRLQARANLTPATSPAPGPAAALPRSAPVAVRIAAIGVHARGIVRLELAADGSIEVPADYGAVGWYGDGPAPGQAGPAVIGGHVDSDTGAAVFYRLGDLRLGDTVSIERADGITARFTVYDVRQYPKDHFPTRRVYGPTGGRAELRLITCGGRFDESAQRYRSNTIVYAHLAPAR